MLQEMRDREASLLRAKREASLADGISWGMGEDAIEEDEVCKYLLFIFEVQESSHVLTCTNLWT